jgi:hypothetical protein
LATDAPDFRRSKARWHPWPAVLRLLSRISLALFQVECQRPDRMRDDVFAIWSHRLRRQPQPMWNWLLEWGLIPQAWLGR